MFRRLIVHSSILLLFLIFSSSANAAGERVTKPAPAKEVQTAPDFTLKDLNGNDVTLSSFSGKKVLLVFSATWCPGCVAEIPDLNVFYQKHQDKDVKLINIDIEESQVKMDSFVKKHGIKYTVLLDSDGEVARQYGVSGIPLNILIDENGAIKYRGHRPQGGFESLLE